MSKNEKPKDIKSMEEMASNPLKKKGSVKFVSADGKPLTKTQQTIVDALDKMPNDFRMEIAKGLGKVHNGSLTGHVIDPNRKRATGEPSRIF